MPQNTTSVAQGASLSQFLSTLTVAGITAAVEVLIFIIIRRIFKRIYAPKTYIGDDNRRVNPLPTSLFGWLPVLLRMPQEDLIRTSGLDAYFFARYLYIHMFFFLSSFVLLAIILFPVYTIDGKGESYGKRGLDILTFGNISLRHWTRYAAPLVLAYVFVGGFLYILYIEMKDFVKKRQALLRSPAYQCRASATTVLLTSVPKAYMSEDILMRIFNELPGGVKHIWLNRNLRDLPDKAEKRAKLVEKLETVECTLIKNALKKEAKRQKKMIQRENPVAIEEGAFDKYIPREERPKMRIGPVPLLSSFCLGKQVDAIDYCKETISQLNTEIEQAKTSLDNYEAINSAFIQFNKPIAAHIAVQCVASSVPLAITPRYIDIKPANIVWANLNLSYYEQAVRRLAMLAATTTLIVFWAIPVGFVGVLANVSYLADTLGLAFLKEDTWFVGLISGLLPTVLLSILMALLPMVLRLFAKISGIPTTDAIDRYLQGSYFIFQVVHAFLFVTITSSVTSVVKDIIEDPSSAATILATNIPTASNFFLSFIALQGLSVAASVLLQIATFVLFYLLGIFFDNTPRKKWNRYFTLSTLSWGAVFPIFTNFIVITLVYSIIAPLMLLISGLAFALFYIAYTYTMFYVSDFPNDSGGLAFSRAIYQSFTGLYLMEVLLAALFLLSQNESGNQTSVPEGILMCVLILITIGVQLTMSSSFDPLTYYLPIDTEEFPRLEKPSTGRFAFAMSAIKVLSIPRTGDTTMVNTNIDHAVNDLNDQTTKATYLHPAIRDPTPVIWIPHDYLGIAQDEVQQTASSALNLVVSTEGALFNEKLKIKISSVPPDHPSKLNDTPIESRF